MYEQWSPVLRGAKYGLYAGVILALIFVNMNTLPELGFYTGPFFLVVAVFGSAGAVIGAGFGWLSTQAPPDDFPPRGPGTDGAGAQD